MSERIQITPAGREVVEVRRERDEARAEVERLQAQLAGMRDQRERERAEILRAMDDMGTSSLSHHILRPLVGWPVA